MVAEVTYSFLLRGAFTPYTRMTRRGQWVDGRAKAYKASQAAIAWQLKAHMLDQGWDMLPARTPLRVSVLIQMAERLHCQDSDNQIKALIDSAQGVVFPNDLWIDEIHATRRSGPDCWAILEIGPLKRDTEKG
jgi:Holliday junction resolvase RusA-like endonuclease